MSVTRNTIVLARHMRVWPTALAWTSMADSARDATARAALELWSARGWPLVVRRQDDSESFSTGKYIAVGLPLPPTHDKGRIKFSVTNDGIASHALPVAGSYAAAHAGPAMPIAQGCQQSFHVYGHHSITGRLAHSARPRVSLLGQRPGSTMTGLSTRAWSGLVSAR